MAKKTTPTKWTLKALQSDAKKYAHRIDWQKGNPAAYSSAMTRGLLEKCCSHMTPKPHPVKWTKQACLDDAKKYTTRSSWARSNGAAYSKARKNGWLEDCCAHMTRTYSPKNRVNAKRINNRSKASCLSHARQYTRRIDWQNNHPSSYAYALKKGWLEECCQHMPVILLSWTKESCLADAQQYTTVTDWSEANPKAYGAANRNGWLKDCTAHMIRKKKWDKQSCMAEAAKYSRKNDWQFLSPVSYKVALMNGWIDECCQHMSTTPFRWTLGRCIADASHYNSIDDWMNASPSAYVTANKKGWLNKCSAHL